MDLEQFPTSETAKRMLHNVSEDFYSRSYVAKWLYQVMGLEMDDARAIIETMQEQAFPETATWGLMYHEIKWGLPVRENLDYETRRRIIYEKRDVKKPVNPYAMEQLVYSITGRQASVRDSNDDPDIPTNTFVLQIESGETDVDLSAVINKIRQIKQSHVSFAVRICARTCLTINTSRTPWKKLFVSTGTVPKTSRGLRLVPRLLELQTGQEADHDFSPMSGNSGNAGLYPKTSRKAEFRGSAVRIDAGAAIFAERHLMSGEGKSGTAPKQSRTLRLAQGGIEIHGGTESERILSPSAGTAPEISRRLALRGAGVNASVTSENHPTRYTLAGTSPAVSRRITASPSELDLSTQAEALEVLLSMAGDGTQAGTAPQTSRAIVQTPDGLSIEADGDAITITSPLSGQGSGTPIPYDENTAGAGISVTAKAYGARVRLCGSSFDL